jgi:hypothetical protein
MKGEQMPEAGPASDAVKTRNILTASIRHAKEGELFRL